MKNNHITPFLQVLPVGNHRGVVRGHTDSVNKLPEILFITSYPPRECGIATYSQDLVKSLAAKFNQSFSIKVCPVEAENESHAYNSETEYILNPSQSGSFSILSENINENPQIKVIVIQHEFGFFSEKTEEFISFLQMLTKPVVIVFHTVIPHPGQVLKAEVQRIVDFSTSIIVMTHFSADVLINDYEIVEEKITVIPHGTHLVLHSDKKLLKDKYQLGDKKVLSTFGLLSSGKNIETTIEALPAIIQKNPDVIFLIIGKTHPSVVKQEGEKYREMLKAKVSELCLENHVKFINYFLPLPDLLEYLQLTDIYLFTSKDPNQAVSGTFSYAISCGSSIVSTPIPHAREVLKNDAGIIIDFENPQQLTSAVNQLLADEQLRKNISSNALHRMASTAWENSAIAHAMLLDAISGENITLSYNIPAINLNHLKKLTTDFGIIQFSKINQPDIESGYTLDDNARAMVAICQHFELTADQTDLAYIAIYLNFIKFCLQPEGYFLNYVNEEKRFTEQNNQTNLADSNGRAVWALGYLLSISHLLPAPLIVEAESVIRSALLNVSKIHSTRAMAFVIKGLYYRNKDNVAPDNILLIKELANRMVQMYKHESSKEWQWYESYLTYGNSILPEAMLCAWLATGESVYQKIARSSFDFLLAKTFDKGSIKIISNKNWLHKEDIPSQLTIGGEQPIDVAYTILALSKFYAVFKDEDYLYKMKTAFNWFLGNNHLHQIIYNPCTGGCYDGLEENYVNLNQGAESTVSYLMARLAIEKVMKHEQENQLLQKYSLTVHENKSDVGSM